MFRTIGHTFQLMKLSWRVLMKDRELILFPVFAGLSVIVAALVFLAIASGTGTLDRMDALTGSSDSESEANIADAILGIAFFFVATSITIFFNSALIAAALERLRGGDPNVGSGLRAASKHIPAILAWAVISVVVALLLRALRQRGGIGGQIASMIGGVAWAYATFFVIPVLVAEGLGPIDAIKRSGSLFRKSWGRQAAASFGFGLVYVVAVLIAVIPAAILFLVSPVLAVIVGVPLVAMAIGTVQALEGIFKAALYEFANGESPLEFDRETLESAYRGI